MESRPVSAPPGTESAARPQQVLWPSHQPHDLDTTPQQSGQPTAVSTSLPATEQQVQVAPPGNQPTQLVQQQPIVSPTQPLQVPQGQYLQQRQQQQQQGQPHTGNSSPVHDRRPHHEHQHQKGKDNPSNHPSESPSGNPGRNPGDDDRTEVRYTEVQPGLYEVFGHIARPVEILSDPSKRDTLTSRVSIENHLNQITPRYVRDALDHDLQGMAGELQDNIQETVEERVRRLEAELLRELNQLKEVRKELQEVRQIAGTTQVLTRLARLEENERLTNKVSTEKIDQVRPNPSYPSTDADEDLLRKASVALATSIKRLDRNMDPEEDPYNHLLYVALEANKVSSIYKLSKMQQRQLVLNSIPSSDPDYTYFGMAETLDDLYQVISVLASQILTIPQCENLINKWRLDNSTDKNMYKSLTSLMNLLKRSMAHRNRDSPVQLPELFKQLITRIQRDPNLPAFIYTKLNEARLRIRDTDKLPELNQILLGSLNAYIGFKPKNENRSPGAAMPENYKVQGSKIHKKGREYVPTTEFSSPCTSPQHQPAVPQTGTPQRHPKQGKTPGQKPQQQQQQHPQGDNTSAHSEEGTSKKVNGIQRVNGNKKQHNFVRPWPENKNYLSKDGNAPSREFEEHFHGYCFKCGHSSHVAANCKVYREKVIHPNLCHCCLQGFHSTCRSRRWGIRKAYVNKRIEEISNMTNYMATNFDSIMAGTDSGIHSDASSSEDDE